MKAFRSFLLALLVLVLPLQSIAREQMRGCGGHRGAAQAAMQHEGHDHHPAQTQAQENASNCQVCSPCCLGAALIALHTVQVEQFSGHCLAQPLASFFTSFQLSTLDPPPRS